MAYNEPDFLPIWARHNAAQLGAAHCYIIDHGTDDGSTDDLGGVNIIRLRRSPQDGARRAQFMADFCAFLMEQYDAVLQTDADEIAVADPAHYADLRSYGAACGLETVAAYGFDVVHTGDDAAIDTARPTLAQRQWMSFSAATSKPVLRRGASPRRAAEFDHLYLFHLRFLDRDMSARRQAGAEQMQLFARFHGQPRNRSVVVGESCAPLRKAVADRRSPGELWPVPERFKQVF